MVQLVTLSHPEFIIEFPSPNYKFLSLIFFNVPILTNHFLRDPYTGKCMFTSLYQILLKQYWTADKTPINLDGLHFAFQKEFPRFRSDEQHDVQETVLCIIDILERSQPIVKEWLYGKQMQETIWPGGKTMNEEDFSIHLSLLATCTTKLA